MFLNGSGASLQPRLGRECLWRRSLLELVPERVGVREVAGCVHFGTRRLSAIATKFMAQPRHGTTLAGRILFVILQLTDLVRVTSFLGRSGTIRIGFWVCRVENCFPASRELAQSKNRRAPGANRLKAYGKGWALKKPLVFPVGL